MVEERLGFENIILRPPDPRGPAGARKGSFSILLLPEVVVAVWVTGFVDDSVLGGLREVFDRSGSVIDVGYNGCGLGTRAALQLRGDCLENRRRSQ
jgi:hypothetical protein